MDEPHKRRYRLPWFTTFLILTMFRVGALFAWNRYQSADFVLGQADFVTGSPGSGSTGMFGSYGLAYDGVNDRLFVVDIRNNRVLVYDFGANGPLIAAGRPADYVLGQPDWSSNGPNGGRAGMNSPKSLYFDSSNGHSRLFVADTLNNRVLVFDFISGPPLNSNGRNADAVLGQVDFSGILPNAGQAGAVRQGMFQPIGITLDPTPFAERLFVSDTGNNRILVYGSLSPYLPSPIPTGLFPDNLLGQSDWTSIQPNQGTGTPGKTTLSGTTSLSYDPIKHWLFESEEGNIRVMIFDLTNPLPPYGSPGSPLAATYVLGQPNFFSKTSNTGGIGPSSMAEGSSVVYDTSTRQAFVADESNNRILVYDLSVAPSNGNMPAASVLGQPDFISNTPDVSQTAINHVEDLAYDPIHKRLFASDCSNSRVLVFTAPPPLCTSPALICGTISTAESPTQLLGGVPIELRSKGGKLLATKKSANNDGSYSFAPADLPASNPLTPFKTYFVTPITGRTQSATPLYVPILSLPATGTQANFRIYGVPGNFQLSGLPPTSFILISTFNYTGPGAGHPPPMGPGLSVAGGFFSAIVGSNGTATVQVPAGSSYYLTCWLAQPSGPSTTYQRVPDISTDSRGPFSISPKAGVPIQCQAS